MVLVQCVKTTELNLATMTLTLFSFLPFLKHVPTGSGAHPMNHSVGTGVLSSGIQLAQHEADHLPSSSVEVKNEWRYTSTLPE
jgi:hypothetical protein